MSDKPTVGRIVHFYDHARPDESDPKYQPFYPVKRTWFHFLSRPDSDPSPKLLPANNFGHGPYPAMVIQTFGNKSLFNIIVFGWDGLWREEFVEFSETPRTEGRYCIWPPRD